MEHEGVNGVGVLCKLKGAISFACIIGAVSFAVGQVKDNSITTMYLIPSIRCYVDITAPRIITDASILTEYGLALLTQQEDYLVAE